MATDDAWTRHILGPAPLVHRARWIHWAAWLGAVVAFVVLLVPLFGSPTTSGLQVLGRLDLALTAAFLLEFFTRSGWRQSKGRYAAERWFDFVAMVPIVFLLGQGVGVHAFFLWAVVAARFARLADRILGDGFVKRHALALLEAVEEEISDRVTLRIMDRIDEELRRAEFGAGVAKIIQEHKQALLERIYTEQFPDEGAIPKIARLTGLKEALERAEARIFDAVVQIVGSPETDALIRDAIADTMARARAEMGQRTWRGRVGLQPSSPTRG